MYLTETKTGDRMATDIITVIEYLIGGAVGSFIIAEIMNYFNNRSADQTFVNMGKEMAETTVVGVQALQDISTMAISSLVGVSGVNDVNNLVKKKVEEQKAS